MKCALFGHRRFVKYRLNENLLKNKLRELVNLGIDEFFVGIHGEFVKIVLSILKIIKLEKNIKINVVYTSLYKINKLENIVPITFDFEDLHFKQQIIFSNKCMVETADIILCYVDERDIYSGAYKAVKYARKSNEKIINLFKN